MNNEYGKQDVQTKLLDIYKEVKKIADEDKVVLSAAFGTLLGAMRHKGFIPWDDDMDFFIDIKDEERFFKALEKKLPPYLKLVNRKVNKHFPYFITRIVDTRYKIERNVKQHKSLPDCLFIDIFTIYPAREKFRWKKSFQVLDHINFFKNVTWYRETKKGKRVMRFWHNTPRAFLWVLPQWFINLCFKISFGLKTSKNQDSKFMIMNDYMDLKYVPTEIFKSYEEVPYEDTTIWVPKQYETYLTSCYGDWRKLPDKIVTHHIKIV